MTASGPQSPRAVEVERLRQAFGRFAPQAKGDLDDTDPDYRLAALIGCAYAARGNAGNCALVIPLTQAPSAVARASFGFSLLPAERIRFKFDDREWMQPAAILECTEPALLDTFVVLANDVATRLDQERGVRWSEVVDIVSEWQELLRRREKLSAEKELGLWAEVSFIARSQKLDELVQAWHGPDAGTIDFVFSGVGAEIKASQTRLVHQISRSQAGRPLGEINAYFVSYCVTLDPREGVTLPMMVDRTLERATDPAEVLRRLLRAGYSPSDRVSYTRPFLIVEEMWFAADDVPQVRLVDSGVSALRYRVTLDEKKQLPKDEVARLQMLFGQDGAAEARTP